MTTQIENQQKEKKLAIGTYVLKAVKNLNEKDGASLAKIKQYIAANTEIDLDAHELALKAYLLRAVKKGTLENVGGSSGSQGRFKIPVKPVAEKTAAETKAALVKFVEKTTFSKTGSMVLHAIINVQERGGPSIGKIRNYIRATYKTELGSSLNSLVKKFLWKSVQKGILINTKKKNSNVEGFKIVDFLLKVVKKKLQMPDPDSADKDTEKKAEGKPKKGDEAKSKKKAPAEKKKKEKEGATTTKKVVKKVARTSIVAIKKPKTASSTVKSAKKPKAVTKGPVAKVTAVKEVPKKSKAKKAEKPSS